MAKNKLDKFFNFKLKYAKKSGSKVRYNLCQLFFDGSISKIVRKIEKAIFLKSFIL